MTDRRLPVAIWLVLAASISSCARVAAEERAAPKRAPAAARSRPAASHAAPFVSRSDARVLRSLATQAVVGVKKGAGGRSLSFKLELSDGTRAYFKPEQTYAAYWYSEVASFHLDRALGLGRVTPVVSRRLPWSKLAGAAGKDERLPELRIDASGNARGAMIAWIDGELVPLRAPPGWEQWLSIDPPPRVSPFQRMDFWKKGRVTRKPNAAPPEPDTPARPAELSDLIVFDYLIGNLDRWGGDDTNVRTLGAGGPLIFLDNANGFEPGRVRTPMLDRRLHAVQRFRRKTIEALRRLEIDDLKARLDREALAPILGKSQLEAIDTRRKHVLEHVKAMQRRHGERALPW